MNRFTAPILSFIICAAACAVYGYLLVGISNAAASASADKTSAAAAGQEESLQKTVQTFVANTASEQAALAGFVATDADVVTIIQDLENAAARENVSLTVGAIAAMPSTWQYHETLQVSVVATGSYTALAALAAELETLPYASHLSRVTFESGAPGSWRMTAVIEFLKTKTAQNS